MSMEDRDGEIWMDGSFVPWRSAKTHLLSYTFQHGAGVFEGLRCYDGERGAAIFRLADHVRRFQDSAKILGMAMPFDTAALADAHCEIIRRNGLAGAYIRPVCYYDGKVVGVSAVGNDVHVAIAAWTWDAYLGADAEDAGITVKTSSFARHHAASTLGKAKANGNYINSMLAVMEARRSGYRDALMLDPSGCVAECSTSNIFMVRHNRLATPDRSHILEGITRDTIMVLAADRDLAVEERRLTRDELYCADELFVTGTAAEITPVIALDDRAIGDGRPGEVTRCLQRAYADAVRGRDAAHLDWLTFIG
jgi:branched-chain amino acid aminotransferase